MLVNCLTLSHNVTFNPHFLNVFTVVLLYSYNVIQTLYTCTLTNYLLWVDEMTYLLWVDLYCRSLESKQMIYFLVDNLSTFG